MNSHIFLFTCVFALAHVQIGFIVFLEHSCDKMELPLSLEHRLKAEWIKQQVILRNEDLQRKYRRVKFTGASSFFIGLFDDPFWVLCLTILNILALFVSGSEYTVDLLHAFTNCSGLDLVFGLNALLRTADNTWNSSNARLLLQYCEAQQYQMSWELGNGTSPHY